MDKLKYNPERVKYMLDMYGLTVEELVETLLVDFKKKISVDFLEFTEIKASDLKKVDLIFNKGLLFYFNPLNPVKSKDRTVLFRKSSIVGKLNLRDKQVVSKHENDFIDIIISNKLSDTPIDRIIQLYSISDNPRIVAQEIRNIVIPKTKSDKRNFLKYFIDKLAEFNIYVFEFIDYHNQKLKASIDGFYIQPNCIVVKKNKYLSREIFTLAHEFGHYLLNDEAIEEVKYGLTSNKVEKWCNDFAFYLLLGEYKADLDALQINSSEEIVSKTIQQISNKTHLSTLAIYTNLFLNNRLSKIKYKQIKRKITDAIEEKEIEEKKKRDEEKLLGIQKKIPAAKPILSPLVEFTFVNAFLSNTISEHEFIQRFRRYPKIIKQYLD